MSDLRELYQEVLLDHYKSPRNFKALATANHKVEGYNPLCGDQITLYVQLDNERIANIGFQGTGCAISVASASMMTAAVKGKTKTEAEALFQQFHDMVTGQIEIDPFGSDDLGDLAALSGVRQYPIRVKCASLAWHALHSVIEGKDQTVSTE